MKWDEWLKKIIKEITSDYTISEETSKSFFDAIVEIIQEPGRNANFYPVF